MHIQLRSLALTNFRGIRSKKIEFDHAQTHITGDNRTGKTTIYNAFLWLLFGKDNMDRKDHEIKTLDENNEPYHRLEHEVVGHFTIEGAPVVISRLFREIWTKKKGSEKAEFNGHETILSWNNVPMKAKDFDAKIATILNEGVFKMITSTSFFNSRPWQERRAMLVQLAGNLEDRALLAELNAQAGKYTLLLQALVEGNKTLEEYKRELYSQKKKIMDELQFIPSRIAEANLSLPELKDYEALRTEGQRIHARINAIDGSLADRAEAAKGAQTALMEKIKQAGEIRIALQGVEYHIKADLQEKSTARLQEITALQNKHREIENEIKFKTSARTRLVRDNTELAAKRERRLNDWHTENNKQLNFDNIALVCYACNQPIKAESIEQAKATQTKNFNESKAKRLAEINASGLPIKQAMEANTNTIATLDAEIADLNTNLTAAASLVTKEQQNHTEAKQQEEQTAATAIATNVLHQQKTQELATLQAEINAPAQPDNEKGALLHEKQVMNERLAAIQQELYSEELRTKTLARIEELQTKEAQQAQELASLEKIEFQILQYMTDKMDALENRINNKFSMVKFKLFRDLVNGGREECCDTLINGVPYNVANTASTVNAGLDIINVMSEHFNAWAPVFVDNRESVVNLLPSKSQIINLVVVAGQPLTVN